MISISNSSFGGRFNPDTIPLLFLSLTRIANFHPFSIACYLRRMCIFPLKSFHIEDTKCLIPCDFAPGLSLPYPSRRLITPHTPTPAPIGCWGMLRNEYLKEHKSGTYTYLLVLQLLHTFQILYLTTSPIGVPDIFRHQTHCSY